MAKFFQICSTVAGNVKLCVGLKPIKNGEIFWMNNKYYYYLFKVFLLFRLAQIPQLILLNQLALSKFGRRLRHLVNDVNSIAEMREKWTVNEKTCITGLRYFGRARQNGKTFYSFLEEVKVEVMPKNIARTARIQVDGWHLLFRKYLQN